MSFSPVPRQRGQDLELWISENFRRIQQSIVAPQVQASSLRNNGGAYPPPMLPSNNKVDRSGDTMTGALISTNPLEVVNTRESTLNNRGLDIKYKYNGTTQVETAFSTEGMSVQKVAGAAQWSAIDVYSYDQGRYQKKVNYASGVQDSWQDTGSNPIETKINYANIQNENGAKTRKGLLNYDRLRISGEGGRFAEISQGNDEYGLPKTELVLGVASHSLQVQALTGGVKLIHTDGASVDTLLLPTVTGETKTLATLGDIPTTASGVSFVSTGGIGATNVQAALVELDTEKANLTGNLFTDRQIIAKNDSNLYAPTATAAQPNGSEVLVVTNDQATTGTAVFTRLGAKNSSSLNFMAYDGLVSGSSFGNEFRFWGFRTASAAYTEAMRLTPSGQLTIGTATADTHALNRITADGRYPLIGTVQPLDPRLTALAGLNTTLGLLVQTGADTFTKRSVVNGTSTVVTNGAGTAGDIAVNLAVTEHSANNSEYNVVWENNSNQLFKTTSKFNFNPSTGTLSSTLIKEGGTLLSDKYLAKLTGEGEEYVPDIKVRAASTANLATLSGNQTVDGIALVAGDLVLLKDQTTQTQRGVYKVNAGAWTRATGFDLDDEIRTRMILVTGDGTTNKKGYEFICTNTGVISPGTTNLTFAQVPFGIGTGVANAAAGNHSHTAFASLDLTSYLKARSFSLTRQSNTPTGTTYSWVLASGGELVLNLASSTGDVTVTITTTVVGATSRLVCVGHATIARNVILASSSTTFWENGAAVGTTYSTGYNPINSHRVLELYWEDAFTCHVRKWY